MLAARPSRTASGAAAIIGVSKMPGATVHTRMPSGAKSRKEPAHQSIHAGTLYHSQGQILERTVEKSKWVTDRPFYGSVPTNRIVTTAGSDPKYSL